VRPDIVIWNHIHQANLDDTVGMIEAQTMRDPPAAVDAGHEEMLVAELLHGLDHVLHHGTEAVIHVVGSGLWQGAVAVAA